MSVSPLPPPRRSPQQESHWTVDDLARELNDSDDMTSRGMDNLEFRIIALEAVIAAPWPRIIPMLLRLRRELRASVATYGDDTPPDFLTRRVEWASEQVILSRLRFDQRYGGRSEG